MRLKKEKIKRERSFYICYVVYHAKEERTNKERGKEGRKKEERKRRTTAVHLSLSFLYQLACAAKNGRKQQPKSEKPAIASFFVFHCWVPKRWSK